MSLSVTPQQRTDYNILTSRLQSLETSTRQMDVELQSLKKENEFLHRDVLRGQEDNGQLKQQLRDLRAEVTSMKQDIAGSRQVREQFKKYDSLFGNVDNLNDRMDIMEMGLKRNDKNTKDGISQLDDPGHVLDPQPIGIDNDGDDEAQHEGHNDPHREMCKSSGKEDRNVSLNEGLEEGHSEVHNECHREGQNEGHNGLEQSHNEGHNEGHREGQNQSHNDLEECVHEGHSDGHDECHRGQSEGQREGENAGRIERHHESDREDNSVSRVEGHVEGHIEGHDERPKEADSESEIGSHGKTHNDRHIEGHEEGQGESHDSGHRETDLRDEVIELWKRLSPLEQRLNDVMKSEVKVILDTVDGQLITGQLVKLDDCKRVVTNGGGCWDQATRRVRTEADGHYLVNVVFIQAGCGVIRLRVKSDNGYHVTIGRTDSDNPSSTSTCVLSLPSRDHVWLEAKRIKGAATVKWCLFYVRLL